MAVSAMWSAEIIFRVFPNVSAGNQPNSLRKDGNKLPMAKGAEKQNKDRKRLLDEKNERKIFPKALVRHLAEEIGRVSAGNAPEDHEEIR